MMERLVSFAEFQRRQGHDERFVRCGSCGGKMPAPASPRYAPDSVCVWDTCKVCIEEWQRRHAARS